MNKNLATKEIFEEETFADALGERYLEYALSTIMSRSLPDVRDGLKPVHRRILYDMMLLKLNPGTAYKKCARVVGDVIGKFHPHGDQAVYETLVRLAQDFTVRYPLIDGQGNFGSIDGDNAAAMRYTESRLTNIALALLQDIDEETVEFKPNYDNQEEEPTILPASFPNLLANGSEGIAVGMATSIPPHNLDELCEATLHLIKDKNVSIDDLLNYIEGPDFPTGGVIIEPRESILSAYKTGRGSFRTRARWHIEELNHGLYQIIITEIPYQVQKSKLIEKIADLYRDKKIALLGNIRDESSQEMRIVLEPRNRTNDANMLMESLFRLTDLEVKVQMNMNVLTSFSIPKVLNFKEVLQEFLDHRNIIILNRSNFRLGKINHRLEVLEGLIIAYLNLDDVIHIIRTEDEAKEILMSKYKLSDVQVESILNMRLRSLRKLEEIEIRKEHDKLSKEKESLLLIINNENVRKKTIADEIKHIQKEYGKNTLLGKRRTSFDETEIKPIITIEALIEKEPITIISSKNGWIRAIKGHQDYGEIKYKEGDEEGVILKAYTTDKLLVFVTSGKFYTISCNNIPRGKGHGDSIKLMVDIEDGDNIVKLFIYNAGSKLIIASSNGKGFIVAEDDVLAQTKTGKKILNVPENEKAAICIRIEGDHVAAIGTNRKLIIFNIAELPEMKKGQGVTIQKYKEAKLSDLKTFNLVDGLIWNMGDKTRTETNLSTWLLKRAQIGKLPPFGFPRDNKF